MKQNKNLTERQLQKEKILKRLEKKRKLIMREKSLEITLNAVDGIDSTAAEKIKILLQSVRSEIAAAVAEEEEWEDESELFFAALNATEDYDDLF